MRLAALSNRFGGNERQPPPGPGRAAPAALAEHSPAACFGYQPDALWTAGHISVLDELFGQGFLLPGGAEEVLQQVRPLDLGSAAALLLLGVGVGGPARVIAGQFGTAVSAYEAEPALAPAGADSAVGAGDPAGRMTLEQWQPRAASLRTHSFERALVLLPLASGVAEAMLMTAFERLQTAGQLVMVDVVAATPPERSEPVPAAGPRAERPSPEPPTEADVTRMLGGLGFDVRGTEDLTERHVRQALGAWQRLAGTMRERRPDRERAAIILAEGERWRLRLQMMREGRLRLVLWHATLWGGG